MSYITKIEISSFREDRIMTFLGGKNERKGHNNDESRRDSESGPVPRGARGENHEKTCRESIGHP